MVQVAEYVVEEFVKIVAVCGDDGIAEIVGDLPALPYCFPKSECLHVGNVEVCWSEWLRLGDFLLRVEGSTVEGFLKAISFHIKGIKCEEVSGDIYYVVRDHILKECSEDNSS